MKYIKLIDYLGKPELIQHVSGTNVSGIHYFPNNQPYARVLVAFVGGQAEFFCEDGIYSGDSSSSFILKPKPKKTITGWRRGVMWANGCFNKEVSFYPTKEAFEKVYGHCTLFGPWESETIEIEDD
jgi:hypothetical protein